MSKKSDRRWFLKLFPQAAAGAAMVGAALAAPQITEAEIVPEPQGKMIEFKELSEEEMIEIASAAAICFGLKPRAVRDYDYRDVSGLGA